MAIMDKNKLEKMVKSAFGAAGDMAARGVEWVKKYSESHCEHQACDVAYDMFV